MLIDQLNKFLKEASTTAPSMWSMNFLLAKKSFISSLQDIANGIEDKNSKIFKSFESVILTFKDEEINVAEIAKSFEIIKKIFEISEVEDKKIQTFNALLKNFSKNAKLFDAYNDKRENLKKNLSKKEQAKLDYTLFEKEGVTYCLEYYLSNFKRIEELTTVKEKLDFIHAKEINFGFGNLIGLIEDYKADEVPQKFILQIFDDNIREELLEYYYYSKNNILENDDINEQIFFLNDFIINQLNVFKKVGIEELTSKFLIPYGKNPKIENLISYFEKNDK